MADSHSDMTVILDHFQQPRNHGSIERPDVDCEEVNAGCGDRVRMQASVNTDGILREVRFVGNGCVISMAAASIVTTICSGSKLDEVVRISEERILASLEASISPRRVDCALLAFRALRSGLIDYFHDRRMREERG